MRRPHQLRNAEIAKCASILHQVYLLPHCGPSLRLSRYFHLSCNTIPSCSTCDLHKARSIHRVLARLLPPDHRLVSSHRTLPYYPLPFRPCDNCGNLTIGIWGMQELGSGAMWGSGNPGYTGHCLIPPVDCTYTCHCSKISWQVIPLVL